MQLEYHRATFDLLGREPVRSAGAVRLLNERERAAGFRFPASVREWYSLEGAVGVLATCGNADHPVGIEQLGGPHRNWNRGRWEDYDCVGRDGLLKIMTENQGCCVWCVRLDGGGDPPVVWVRRLPAGSGE